MTPGIMTPGIMTLFKAHRPRGVRGRSYMEVSKATLRVNPSQGFIAQRTVEQVGVLHRDGERQKFFQ